MDIKDIFIIGGGINGVGIAADAAGRGLSVSLCEKNDLAYATSSASTKLIHGGLRYLESYEFNLVRKALLEREILMRKAPNLVKPLKFLLPYEKHLRSPWLIRLGLFLYDHLAPRKKIPRSKKIKFKKEILKEKFKKGFSYYDCFTDDARLVVLNAISAKENGAEILTQTEFVSAERVNSQWKITVKNDDKEQIYFSKVLINASGPWVYDVNNRITNGSSFSVQLVKGSHIVVPKLYEGDFAYILQNQDKRIVFAIPYQNDFTLIGTTDILVSYAELLPIAEHEINYLCNTINQYFRKNISKDTIVWTYSGIRCLQNQDADKPSSITREYSILLDVEDHATPLISVIGGKLTTFRRLAQDVLAKLKPFFPKMPGDWTADSPLPGCDFHNNDFDSFLNQLRSEYHWLPENILIRYATNYGTRCKLFLNNTAQLSDLGEHFGAGLYQKEIDYLIEHEWAKNIDDIIWRRTKLGLFLTAEEKEKLLKTLVQ